MKVLMIGLGSIGQRHLRNLRQLYGDTIEISAYRVRGLKRTFTDQMEILEGVNVEEKYKVKSFDSLQAALKDGPDVAFITNITSKHLEPAMEAVKSGCHIFMEKPVSNSMAGVNAFIEEAEKNHVSVFVGYQYRYHICLLQLKKYLEQKTLGNIISVHGQMGERLRGIHTYESYKETYMARKDMGGGVILNQMIHELDYIQWLFGTPKTVYALKGSNKSLDLDVDDYCQAIYQIPMGGRSIPVSVHGDFFQSPPVRRCTVIGDQGRIEIDLLKNELILYREDIKTYQYPHFKRNDMFLNELKDFMEGIKRNKTPSIDLSDGVISLKMALGAIHSSETGMEADIEKLF